MQVQAFSPVTSYSYPPQNDPVPSGAGSPSNPMAGTGAPSAGRSAEHPDRSDDAYASYVRNAGAQQPLSASQLNQARRSIVQAAQKSLGRLADPHTAETITKTVLDALSRSQTFRDAVSFGLHNDAGKPLADITYRNEYALNPGSSPMVGGMQDQPASGGGGGDMQGPPASGAAVGGTQSLAAGQPQDNDTGNRSLAPLNMAAEDGAGRPYVSFSVAPNTNSPYMPLWEEGLIHEIIHQITGAGDPANASPNRLGPTEILARRIAHEMGLHIPDFRGYGAPERNAMLDQRNAGALREAAARHGSDAGNLFKRLDTISKGHDASPDFRDLGTASAANHPQEQYTRFARAA